MHVVGELRMLWEDFYANAVLPENAHFAYARRQLFYVMAWANCMMPI